MNSIVPLRKRSLSKNEEVGGIGNMGFGSSLRLRLISII
jgi:hypothetical protein